jgi:hypothetical protein
LAKAINCANTTPLKKEQRLPIAKESARNVRIEFHLGAAMTFTIMLSLARWRLATEV